VGRYRFLPILSNPLGLINLASWTVPTSLGSVSPACLMETVPSVPMEMDVASVGIEISGSKTNPSEVTTRPSPSSLNDPALE